MPVSMCSSCHKMISISQIPGGNPTAKLEGWATAYGICEMCKQLPLCDVCINKHGGKCPNCGRKIEIRRT
jgi:hypothetical protein